MEEGVALIDEAAPGSGKRGLMRSKRKGIRDGTASGNNAIGGMSPPAPGFISIDHQTLEAAKAARRRPTSGTGEHRIDGNQTGMHDPEPMRFDGIATGSGVPENARVLGKPASTFSPRAIARNCRGVRDA